MNLEPSISIHFIDCGQGNMTLIVTPSAVVLYDCRVTKEDEQRILGYLRTYIPFRENGGEERQWIDWFICSHRDSDHFHGLCAVNESFPILGIVDPGTTCGSVDGDENKYYMSLRRRIDETYGNGALIVPEASTNPFFNIGGVLFYCLCSGKDDPPSEDGHYGNNVFQVEYGGNRVLLTGDSDWRSWKERIVPSCKDSGLLATTVLVASHHGSRSFFLNSDSEMNTEQAWAEAYGEHLEAISPSMTIISCGDQDHLNHPDPTALSKYKQATKHEQVYLTREKGTLIGQFYADGRWTVTPARFLRGWKLHNYSPTGKELIVGCSAYKGDQFVKKIESGDILPVGHKLRFNISTRGGLIGDFRKAKYLFEVSNGGQGSHSDRDEIYYKGTKEQGNPHEFNRDLSFVGTHLLRCRVRYGSLEAQKIFVITGTPREPT